MGQEELPSDSQERIKPDRAAMAQERERVIAQLLEKTAQDLAAVQKEFSEITQRGRSDPQFAAENTVRRDFLTVELGALETARYILAEGTKRSAPSYRKVLMTVHAGEANFGPNGIEGLSSFSKGMPEIPSDASRGDAVRVHMGRWEPGVLAAHRSETIASHLYTMGHQVDRTMQMGILGRLKKGTKGGNPSEEGSEERRSTDVPGVTLIFLRRMERSGTGIMETENEVAEVMVEAMDPTR